MTQQWMIDTDALLALRTLPGDYAPDGRKPT